MPSRDPLERRPVCCQARISSAQLRVVSTIWRYSGNCPVSTGQRTVQESQGVLSWSFAYRGRAALGETGGQALGVQDHDGGVESFRHRRFG